MSGLWKQMAFIAQSKWYAVDILDISTWETQESELLENMRFIQGDISKVDDVFLEKLSKGYDIVICNAGISLSGNFIHHSSAENNKLMNINTMWHIELIRLLLSRNIINTKWSIGFIASASEMLPFPIALWYAATKWALRAFAVSLRSYLIWQDISVSVVYPWPIPTAHVKYYGKEVSHNEKTQKKVHNVAQKTFKGIEKRKRNIYPDIASKSILLASPFQWILDRIMYKAYKKDIS